ncbi:methylenetetrahydrofolate dehydrogenase [Penicillium longicatenatum]|nr:methylenetetrahydrofolate dehydrogenase [Penicillium longicatenatum]
MRAPRALGETILPEDLTKEIYAQLAQRVQSLPTRLCLTALLASDDAGSHQYAEWTRETCHKIGIDFCLVRLTPRNVATYIKALNENSSVHGIMVYYPIFGDARDDEIKSTVDPRKDVEGLNRPHSPHSHEVTEDSAKPRLAPTLVPCTAKAVETILHWLGIYDRSLAEGERLNGWDICIINRSDVVGLPLAQLLASQGARVYSVDIIGVQIYQASLTSGVAEVRSTPSEWTLQDVVKKSGVIISAVPHRTFKVNTEWIQRGTICINVASAKNFDAEILEVASKFVPRVGNLTIAALLDNLLQCTKVLPS